MTTAQIDYKSERRIVPDTELIHRGLHSHNLDEVITALRHIRTQYTKSDETLELVMSRGDYQILVRRGFDRPETDKEIRHRLHQEREQVARLAKQGVQRMKKAEQRAANDRAAMVHHREELSRLESLYPEHETS
jgi:hypothetical protein